VQEALQVTWLLKGKLKSAQIAYLRIGELLVKVRDQKLYSELKHADMEDYAEKRLQLGRASLFRYIQVYDWVSKSHPEWLQPKPKGFIPDLNDAVGLIWIENELARTNLTQQMRADLENLRKKALDGQLKKSELNAVRQQEHGSKDGAKSFLSKLRLLRKRGSALTSMPQEVITHLDAAIEILKNSNTLKLAGLDFNIELRPDRRQFC